MHIHAYLRSAEKFYASSCGNEKRRCWPHCSGVCFREGYEQISTDTGNTIQHNMCLHQHQLPITIQEFW